MIKKLLAFLLLFGLGLGALLLLDKDLGRGDSGRDGSASGSSVGSGGPARVANPLTAGGARASGPADHRRYGATGRDGKSNTELMLTSENTVQSADGRTEFINLEIQRFDPTLDSDEPLAKVIAARGVIDIPQDASDFEFKLGSEIALEQVEVQLRSGNRLVPLTVRSEHLICNIDDLRFSTPGFATIEGNGIYAEGNGLQLDEERARIEFASHAKVIVRPAAVEGEGKSQPGRISCAGQLVIEQLPPVKGRNPLWIRAKGQALLAVESRDALSVDAGKIDVQGEIEPNGGSFAFQRLIAESEVTLRAKQHRFQCNLATFDLDSNGDLVWASLEGNPEGTILLEEGALAGTDEALDMGAGDNLANIWGKGPMSLSWTPKPSFQIAGPASLSWRDAELSAAGNIVGSPSGDESGTPFRAFNGVRFDIAGWRLETEQIAGTARGAEVELQTEGYTSIEGTTSDGSDLDLIAREGFEFDYENGTWVIPRAELVDLVLTGTRSLSASALALVNFNPELPSFEALGNVSLHQGLDELHGERMLVNGDSYLELEGTLEDPVLYEAPVGTITAAQIKRVNDRIEASGSVVTDMNFDDFELDLRAEKMSIVGAVMDEIDSVLVSPSPGQPTSVHLKRPLILEAEGNVHSKLISATESYDVQAGVLRLERESLELRGLEGRRRYRTGLSASGGVEGEIEGELGHFLIEADELDGRFVDPFESAEDARDQALVEASAGSLDARGNVYVTKLDAPQLTGRGDVFHVGDDRKGRLQSTLPDRPVRAEGVLPETGEPFSLKAAQVDFGPDFLAGRQIILVVVDRGTPAIDRGRFALSEILVESKRFEATGDQVEFIGDVSFTGKTSDEHSWNLRAALVRFDNSLGERATKTGVFDRLVAEKDVNISFSDGPEASGDYLTADSWSGRVRITGNPARLYKEGPYESEWFEVSTREDYLLRMGAGIGILPGSGSGSGKNTKDDK